MRTEVLPSSLLRTIKQYITDTRLPIPTAPPIFLSRQLLWLKPCLKLRLCVVTIKFKTIGSSFTPQNKEIYPRLRNTGLDDCGIYLEQRASPHHRLQLYKLKLTSVINFDLRNLMKHS